MSSSSNSRSSATPPLTHEPLDRFAKILRLPLPPARRFRTTARMWNRIDDDWPPPSPNHPPGGARDVPSSCRRGDLMPFIQIIEYKTDRIVELNAALDGWLAATKGKRAADRGVQTKDRDATNTYVQIVEFPSHEAAMAN